VPSMKQRTTEEAAEAVKISRATLQVWIASGKIKAPEVQLIDGKAVRLWNVRDIERLRAVKAESYGKGRTGRPRKDGTR
jgi:excisionase family DNA binding protein